MDPGMVVTELLRRRSSITAAEKKILMNIVQQEAPELLQPSTVKRLPRGIWGKITDKFNKDTNSTRNVRELKGCIQNMLRKAIQKKSGTNKQLLTCGASNFTPYEKSLVISLVKSNLIVLSKQKDNETQKEKRRAWAGIMWAFNKTPGIECQRTAMEIKTCLMNLTNRSDRRDVQELRLLVSTPGFIGKKKSMSLGQSRKKSLGQGRGLAFGLKPRLLLPKPPSMQSTYPAQPLLYAPPHTHTAPIPQTNQSLYTQQPNTIPIHTSTSVAAARANQLYPSSGLQVVPPPPVPQGIFTHNPSHPAPVPVNLSHQNPGHTIPAEDIIIPIPGSPDISIEQDDAVIEIKEESSPGSSVAKCADIEDASVGHGQNELGTQAGEINAIPGNLIQLEKVMSQGQASTGVQSSDEPSEPDGLSSIQIRVHRDSVSQESLPRLRSPPQSIAASTRRISSPLRSHLSPPAACDGLATVVTEHGGAGTSSGITDWPGSSEQHQYQNTTHDNPRHLFQNILPSTSEDDSVQLQDDTVNNVHRAASALNMPTFNRASSRNTNSRDRLLHRDNHMRRDGIGGPRTSLQDSVTRRRSKVNLGRETLGKMKRRLLHEEHDLKLSLMREQHAWLLEEHMWKREEHELRMNMIRMNSKF